MTKTVYRETYFLISLAGETLSVDDLSRIDNIKIIDTKEDLSKAEFDVSDYDLEYQEVFREGTTITIEMGYLEGDFYIFTGEISIIDYKFPADGNPILKVKCNSRAKELMEEQKQVVWQDKSRSQVVKEIAESYGLKAYVKATKAIHSFQSQTGITDAAFIRKLADQEGYLFNVRGDTLYWGPEGTDREEKRILNYRTGDHSIKACSLKFKVEDDARGVTASQINEREGDTVTATAEGSVPPSGSEPSTDLAQESTGTSDGTNLNQGEFENYQGGSFGF